MLTVQIGLVPLHAPPQPANVEPDEGVAVSVTAICAGSGEEQLSPPDAGQWMPRPVTVPDPVPWAATESVCVPGVPPVKLAFTDFEPLMTSEQKMLEPAQLPPLQPENVAPGAGVATKLRLVFCCTEMLQTGPPDDVQ
jgi:hypothetical protein